MSDERKQKTLFETRPVTSSLTGSEPNSAKEDVSPHRTMKTTQGAYIVLSTIIRGIPARGVSHPRLSSNILGWMDPARSGVVTVRRSSRSGRTGSGEDRRLFVEMTNK